MKTFKLKNVIMLITAALIWGCAFVAQSVGMDYVGPFTFNSMRFLLGGLVLVPVIIIIRLRQPGTKKRIGRQAVAGGLICGCILFVSAILQQYGILYSAPGKAGFITALYIIIVPILGLFLKRKTTALLWISAAVAVAGMYFLCLDAGFRLQIGDALLLMCAFGFAIHIMVIDRFSPLTDGVALSCIQFLTAGLLCFVCMVIFEEPSFEGVAAAWLPIAYTGVLSCGVAYTFQILAQKDTSPVLASLLLSLESVFAVLASVALLGDVLSARELLGCALMFAAIVMAQIPAPRRAAD